MEHYSFDLASSEAEELQAAYRHCQDAQARTPRPGRPGQDAQARTRYQAVRLYGTGYSAAQVQQICGCPLRTLQHWARAYRQRGPSALLDHRQGGNRARLTPGREATAPV